jgi:argininosuccinate lyase
VREALEKEISLSDLEPETLRGFSEHLDEEYYEVLEESSWLESKELEGGTGSAPLGEQISAARNALSALESILTEKRS